MLKKFAIFPAKQLAISKQVTPLPAAKKRVNMACFVVIIREILGVGFCEIRLTFSLLRWFLTG